MLEEERTPTVSSVRTQFSIFFERVMVLYNLAFFKEEKSHRVEDVKRFAIELFEADKISEYIKITIDEAIENFASLLPGKEVDDLVLDYFDASISLSTYEVNAEIGELIH